MLIDFDIISKAGEHFSSVIMRDNKRLCTPKVKIIDGTGDVLAFGKFDYG